MASKQSSPAGSQMASVPSPESAWSWLPAAYPSTHPACAGTVTCGLSPNLGAEEDDTLRTRLEKCARGVPVILTPVAASEALRLMGVRRLAVIHPPWFAEEVSAKGKDYFQKRGMEVVFCARMTPLRKFTEVPPTEVFDWVKANVPREAEAVFIGGNGLRAIGVIQALEESFGKPVLSANQVAFWQALRLVGMTTEVSKHGRLFTESAAQP